MTAPKIIDDDECTIRAETPLKVVRSWSYTNREEQRQGMRLAREFAEGWFLAERAHKIPERDLSEFTAAYRKNSLPTELLLHQLAQTSEENMTEVVKFERPAHGVIVFGDLDQWAVTQDDHCLRFHPNWQDSPDLVATHIWREAWIFVFEQGGFDAVMARLRGEA